ncbi:MAG: bifunctional 3,4-dihydroxy-2-butanone-4-phosphate synthase/GTP cyclohydrolase II [Cyanobacteriota bacterium]|nr:bifunctional 3,4-dihydroxy-2-butanone-4-phosphate synthase/GTP cyclohydrolase II [Cyanobacteriota bacterium]
MPLSSWDNPRIVTASLPVETTFHSVPEALDDLKSGRVIIVVDDENRENEGDLICAAQFATPQIINFMAMEARGLICLSMQGERLDELRIPLMVGHNTDSNQTAFTVSVDAAPHFGVSTGISAADRSKTIQAIIHPKTQPEDLRRPGHIFPLRARDGGVLKRAGHTEAAVDLAILAGLYPAGVICEIQNPDGTMARLPELVEYGKKHDLKIITIASLIEYRLQNQRFVHRESIARLPSEFGEFQVYGYRDTLDQAEHLAIVKGDPSLFSTQEVLVRVHSECLTGDALGSLRCDCRRQLETALKMIEYQGRGVVLYLRQEGRGIGLLNKLKAYSLQDMGLDTVQANEHLGFAPDLRNYGVGAQILRDLGIHRMRLITNNPRKISGLKGFGLELVERVPLLVEENDFNTRYLHTKALKLGHLMLQTRLLTVALYPQSVSESEEGSLRPSLQNALWMEKLRRWAAADHLLVQEDSRPLVAAVFGNDAVVAHVGLAESTPSGIPWYEGGEAVYSYQQTLLDLLIRIAKSPDLKAMAWMVSAGHHPLEGLRGDLQTQPQTLAELIQWQKGSLGSSGQAGDGAALPWLPQTIYHLYLDQSL